MYEYKVETSAVNNAEKLMNKLLVFILIIQGILSIVSAITNAILYNKNLKEAYKK